MLKKGDFAISRLPLIFYLAVDVYGSCCVVPFYAAADSFGDDTGWYHGATA